MLRKGSPAAGALVSTLESDLDEDFDFLPMMRNICISEEDKILQETFNGWSRETLGVDCA